MVEPSAPAPPSRAVPTRVAVWALRVLWLAVAVFGGGAVGAALDGRSDAVVVVVATGAWIAWAAAAIAMAVPAVATLTIVRAVVPVSLVAVGAVTVAGAGAGDVAALAVPGVLATTVAASAELGRAFVQASAYGDEQRFPLRPPLGYLAAVAITWVVMVAGALAAMLGWPARAWVIAGAGTVVVAAGGWLLPRRWHQLSRRWLVFVPAGLVVHDPVVLADTVLLRRPQIAGVRLAPMGTTAADLTGPSPGPAVEVATRESVTAVLAPTPQQPRGRVIHLVALLVAPSRPGAALAAAGRNRLPVG